MTTATTTTDLNHTTSAQFQAWYNEIITQLLNVGLTQTTDTGQIGATASIPAINTAAGYTIWMFNDSLSGSYPIYIKLEFGTGAVSTEPQIWITIGTGSNGSGTLTGTVSTRVATCVDVQAIVAANAFTSYFVYNTTYGVLGMAWKSGAMAFADPGLCYGGFYIFRGSTSTGAVNNDVAVLMSGSGTATGPTIAVPSGFMQCLSYANTTIYPTAIANGVYWTMDYFQMGQEIGTTGVIRIAFYMSPAITISAVLGVVCSADIQLGETFTATILGSTPLTFINVGGPFGSNTLVSANASSSGFSAVMGVPGVNGGFGVAFLWE